jgi:ectoine hydroxylase-related dioxygenase (phytanoyl-CoA dioxygenase family)
MAVQVTKIQSSQGGPESREHFIQRLLALLPGQNVAHWVEAFETQGFCVIPELLDAAQLQRQKVALAPWVEDGQLGRNVFEGTRTHRIYAMLAKDPAFSELVAHPVSLAWAEHYLGRSCLLSACLAIHLQPGESAQPWHTDDGHTSLRPPHDLLSVSTFWALDETTLENGATEVLPGSHRWSETDFPGVLRDQDFGLAEEAEGDAGAHPDAVKVTMPAGSLMIARGDLWHRGGANRSDTARCIVTPQYCAGWLRPLESMLLSVPPEQAAVLPERVRELLGYSIHPPFMGYSDGMHPQRTLQ